MNAVRIVLVLSILALGGMLVFLLQPAPEADPASGQGGDFTLHSSAGEVSLSDFRGQVVVLYLGYTFCPDVCPMSLAILGQALRQLPETEREQIQGIFISVDPERDTPERLDSYASFFSPQLIGVTGSQAEIDRVVRQYGAFYRRVELRDSAMGYAVDHSSQLYLINRRGELVGSVSHTISPDQLVTHLHALLEEN